MRSRKITIWVMVTVLANYWLALPKAAATVLFFDDGVVHDVSWATDIDVVVLNSYPEHTPTTLNLLAGGRIGTIGQGDSDLNVFGASVINMFDSSDVEHDLIAHDDSTVNIYGGSVHHDLITLDASQVNMYGGGVGPDLHIKDDSHVTISGGWVGGGFGGSVFLRNDSVTVIKGSNFEIDGQPLGYGVFTTLDITSGKLTGMLLGGQPLNSNFYLYDNASLVLIPEPATLFLLGLGAVMLRRK